MTKEQLVIVSILTSLVGFGLIVIGFVYSGVTILILLLILMFNWESKLKKEEGGVK